MKLSFTIIGLFMYCWLNAQKAGTLDSSFGVDGKVLTAKNAFHPDISCSAALTDESIIAGGTISGDSSFGGFFACKYSKNGTPDTSFGKHGVAILHNVQYAEAMAIQPDNKIVMCGYGIGFRSYFICIGRFNANGTIDSAFGNNGTIITVDGENSKDIAIQPDGKILIAGNTGTSFLTLRYLPNGTLDSSFGNNGEVLTYLGLGNADAISVLPNGKIIVVGSGVDKNILIRYNTNGSVDSTFGINGKASFFRNDETGLVIEGVTDMIVGHDGKILLTGVRADLRLNISDNVLIRRFTENGNIDSLFGNNGSVVNNFGYNCQGRRIALEKGGKIIISGYVTDLAYESHFLIERYTINGRVDHSFGSAGHHVTKMSKSDIATGLILQKDGKIVLTGAAFNGLQATGLNYIALARYNNKNNWAATFSENYNQIKTLQNKTYNLYPNPAQNVLHLAGLLATKTKLTVIDFMGNVKLQTAANTSSYNLNIAALTSGNYLLKIEMNGAVVTKKFVKK